MSSPIQKLSPGEIVDKQGEMIDRQKALAKRNGQNGHRVLPPEINSRFDDVATAERFLEIFGEELQFLAESNKWLKWDGKRWSADTKDSVFELATIFAGDLYSPEKAISKETLAYAQRANSRTGLNAFLDLAARKKKIGISEFDAQPYLINCVNGTLDLRTGALRAHDRSDLFTKIVNAEYDPDAKRDFFDEFLETIQPDPVIRAFLQRSIGYSLLGTVRERSFWILHGTGNNGKSIFLTLFNNLLGDYASGTTTSSIMLSKGGGIPNDIARLRGKRFIVVPETEENERLNSSLVKALSAGDQMTARFLFGEFFDFYFTGKLWIATNHLPRITDHSKGFWERLKVVPFSQDIPADKVIKSDDLMAQLMSEAPAILAWAVQGCRDYLEMNSLDTPEVIRQAVDEFRKSQDSIGQFLEERCETLIEARARAPDEYHNPLHYRVSNAELYRAYKKFCDDNGEYSRSHRLLSQSMKERGYRQMNSGGRYWEGVRLIDGT
jgi:putative DNA primase/helicase